jgi:hypothetical protein
MAKQVVTGEGIADNNGGQKRPFFNDWLPLARISIMAWNTQVIPSKRSQICLQSDPYRLTSDRLPSPATCHVATAASRPSRLKAVRFAQP